MINYHNIGTCFDERVRAYLEQTALVYADASYTYHDLHNWSIELSKLLMEQGCVQGDVIAILNAKSTHSYALMLAALRIGVAYVNIDPSTPVFRLDSILNTCKPRMIFCEHDSQADLLKQVSYQGIISSVTDRPAAGSKCMEKDVESMRDRVDGSSIAYIMFTSGSTGAPKGVAVTHQNVLHFMSWGINRFKVNSEDNFANVSPMYFDNSVFDFYVGLFSGASITPITKEMLNSPLDLVNHVAKAKCTVWFSVPSLLMYLATMKVFEAETLPSLRTIIFGGEGYPKVELKKLYDEFSLQAEIVNVYGPTECTCICSAHSLCDDDFVDLTGLPKLGHLNQNFDHMIIDGELCLGGPNVAAGYFNDVERTQVSFKLLRDSSRFMKRMYHTGDIVEEREGELHYVCRKDNQIKHMGYRIELEEIEHALVRLDEISQASVIYLRSHAVYGKLIAFVATSSDIDGSQIKDKVKAFLPEYMLPHKFFTMPQLPKNQNGKVDKTKLKTILETV